MSFPLIKLGDLFEIQIGKTPSRANQNYWTNGLYNWLSIADMNQGKYLDRTKEKINDLAVKESNIKLILENTVVLSYKLSIGKVGITKKSMFTNEAIASLIPLNNNIDINFLYWALQHIDLMANTDRAAMGQTLNKAKLKEIKIPLPSLSEQKCIAEILDKADELRQKRQQSIEKLDELLQATFIDMFGDPVTNPKNLDYIQLGKLGNWASGGTPSRSNKTFFNGTIPWYTSGELNNIYVSDSIEKISIEAIENSSTKLIPRGSLLLGMYDTAGLKSSITTIDSACNQAIAFAKINDNLANKLFVYHQIQLIKEHLKQKQRGVRQKNFNLTMIKEIEILNPKLELQNSFAKTAARIEQQKQTLLKQLNEQKNLFQSLQQRAFNGEL